MKQTKTTILPLLAPFRDVFSAPTFQNFRYLLLSWLMNPTRGWISNCLRAFVHMPGLYPSNGARRKHFSVFYRFFTRSRWSLDALGHVMVELLENWLPESLTVIVDDTLTRRTGPMILGAGMHHDPLRSNPRAKRQRAFSFGLNFVVLALWLPLPWDTARGVALPVLFRLYRSRKYCPPDAYTKRTKLAGDMIGIVRSWWPNRRMDLVVDHEYVCKEVMAALDKQMTLTGPIRPDASLFQPGPPAYSGRGRKPIWGAQVASPKVLAEDASILWQEGTFEMYGKPVRLLYKTMQARWKSAGAHRILTIVVTRDPRGMYRDAYFLRAEVEADVSTILVQYCRRWSLEVTYRDGKQLLHIEQIQNGFVHRKQPALSHRKTRPGPQAPLNVEPMASSRTVPFFMLGYTVVVCWYFQHGHPVRDIKWAKFLAPWWGQKETVSFRDMLQAFRRQMEHEQLWTNPPQQGFDEKYLKKLPFRRPHQEFVAAMAG